MILVSTTLSALDAIAFIKAATSPPALSGFAPFTISGSLSRISKMQDMALPEKRSHYYSRRSSASI
ncbi:MAG: hypothetical protein FIB07_08540 [Candidatus Methanoperedens sp.]|nr:hypothetical protein [Candidatus Methanoperedens sp.]